MDNEPNNINLTDLTFFTNEKGDSLLNRFKATLKDTQLFDLLVGYFRASGFYQLYESFETIDKIRILVGLNVDRDSYDIIQYNKQIITYLVDLKSIADEMSDEQKLSVIQSEYERLSHPEHPVRRNMDT
jgi:hypothetical protein